MTLSEFKAWLEGFEEAMGGNPPSADQWKAIKAKLAKVGDKPSAVFRQELPKGWNDRVRMELDPQPLIARYSAQRG